ncbi:MAG: ABC transporter substrate-binding protein [Peptococcaceae bacterium]|jgi:iron complex transport system substrate-binding protein|nr:ABC transporter substrate-binding protein [Peptococcaceae bacterium]
MNKVHRFLILALVSLMLGAAAAACGSNETQAPAQTPAETQTQAPTEAAAEVDYTVPVPLPAGTEAASGLVLKEGDKITVYDYDKVPFTFKAGSIQKMINLWPANTAGVLALGAEPFFIANIGMTSPYQTLMFPDYAALSSVSMTVQGTSNINSEAILAMEPDLIISHPTSIEQWRSLEAESGVDLPVINVNFTSYDEMKTTYKIVGAILGGEVERRAEIWAQMLTDNVDRIARGLAGVTDTPIVFYSAGGENMGGTLGMNDLSQSVVTNEWCTYAGGKYWPKWMLEQGKTVAMSNNAVNPEAILDNPPAKIFIGGGQTEAMNAILDGSSEDPWTGIVKNLGDGNAKYIPYALFDWARFGAESALMVLWAAREIHPDVFADPATDAYIDMHAETKAFYKDFAGYDISDGNVDNILAGLPPAGTN